MRKRAPTHPGAILREDVLPTLGMSVTEFAKHLDISRQTLDGVLAEKLFITPELSLCLGVFLGNGPNLWSDMQANLMRTLSHNKIRSPPLVADFSNNDFLINETLNGSDSVDY